jgi:hypothetical protein
MEYEGILRCHQTHAGEDYDLILVGDSHAEHLFHGLATVMPGKHIVYAVSRGAPVPENASLKKIYGYLASKQPSKKVDLILGGAWVTYLDDPGFTGGVEKMISSFQKYGYRVTLTDDIPIFLFQPSLCKTRRLLSLREPRCRETAQHMHDTRARVQRAVASLAAATGARVLATHDFLKDGSAYFMAKDGRMLYRDNQHLNLNGSLYLARRLQETGQLKGLMEK